MMKTEKGAGSMVTRRQTNVGLVTSAVIASTPALAAQGRKSNRIAAATHSWWQALMQVLMLRRSTREYADRPLPLQTLSDLLWSAFGINRPATGDRTAPYWRHVMVIDIYAAMADGVWLYEPKRHALIQHQNADIRASTGLQDFVATAPLNLIYVAHGERMMRSRREKGASVSRF
jgi:hypothetical protein